MSKNKKRFLSVLLAFAMLCSIVSPAWAEVPRSEEGYYALDDAKHGDRYISDITIADDSDNEFRIDRDGNVIYYFQEAGIADGCYLDKDLNDNAGGHYVFIGWSTTADINNAITGLRLLKWENDEPPVSYDEDGITWNLVQRAVEMRRPFLETYPIIENTNSAIDLNAGAGGDYIYLYTMTGLEAANTYKLSELLKQAKECLNNSEHCADISELQAAYDSGNDVLNKQWGGINKTIFYAKNNRPLIYSPNPNGDSTANENHEIASRPYYVSAHYMVKDINAAIAELEKALGNLAVNETVGDADLSIVMQIKDKILLNGKQISSDAAPIIVDNRAMVPIRVLPTLLGGTADWDEATRTVTLNMGGEVYSMTIDQPISNFGTSVVVRDNHVYVPIRYVAEKLGANVEWNAAAQQVLIEKWNEM